MGLGITKLHPHIGAEIAGLDLSAPIDSGHRPGNLARDRPLRRAGVPRPASDRPAAARFRGAVRRIGDRPRRRCGRDGGGSRSRRSATSRTSTRTTGCAPATTGRRLDSLGNRLWHTDASYMPVPVVLGMLFAVAVPPASPLGGGETEFADMRAAYDALTRRTEGGDRRSGRRARRVLVARPDRLYRISARRARAVPAVAPAPGAPPSGVGPQDAVPVGARLAHRRLAGARGAPAARRPDRARDAAAIRLQPQMAGRRSRDLGQPRHDASRPAARRDRSRATCAARRRSISARPSTRRLNQRVFGS